MGQYAIKNVSSEIAERNRTIVSLRRDVEELQEELQAMKKKMSDAEKRHLLVAATLQDMSGSLEKIRDVNADLITQLREAREGRDIRQLEIDRLNTELVELRKTEK